MADDNENNVWRRSEGLVGPVPKLERAREIMAKYSTDLNDGCTEEEEAIKKRAKQRLVRANRRFNKTGVSRALRKQLDYTAGDDPEARDD